MKTPKSILVLGSGGREHALAWRLAADEGVENVIVAPGNPGMLQTPKIHTNACSPSDFEAVATFVKDKQIELVVVGPEVPLSQGIVDFLNERGIAAYGPSQYASQLESSKIFSKELMQKAGVPTAAFKVCRSYDDALKTLSSWPTGAGVVVKADGLAAGKGVIVCQTHQEAQKAIHDLMVNQEVSIKTDDILLEETLFGKELSVFALCDGNDYFILGHACDYKRVGEGDIGPNTGGMGCYIPQNWPSEPVMETIKKKVIEPVLSEMKKSGHPFKGTLFCGLMVDGEDVNVIEFNVRFGDPETQTLLPALKGPFAKSLMACATGGLNDEIIASLSIKEGSGIHVVMASKGYPSIDKTPVETGHAIHFDEFEGSDNIQLFFAGVKREGDFLLNSGGRVLGVSAQAENIEQARRLAYAQIDHINFEGAHFRRDIGQ